MKTEKTLTEHLAAARAARGEKNSEAARANGTKGGRPPLSLRDDSPVYTTSYHNGGGFVDVHYYIHKGEVFSSENLAHSYKRVRSIDDVIEPVGLEPSEGYSAVLRAIKGN